MKNMSRPKVVSISLLALALGVTGIQASLAGGHRPPKKTRTLPKMVLKSWNQVVIREKVLVCDDPYLLKVNGLSKSLWMVTLYVVTDSKYDDLTGMYFIRKDVSGTSNTTLDIVRGSSENLKQGKSPKLDVIWHVPHLTIKMMDLNGSVVTSSQLEGSLKGRSVARFMQAYKKSQLSIVLRDIESGIILCSKALTPEKREKNPIVGDGITNEGDFKVKPTPPPPPSAP